MQKVDLIVANAGELLTCSSPSGPKRSAEMRNLNGVRDGAVAVAAGLVVAVGTTETIRAKFVSNTEIDAARRIVCPGFVDPHTHIVYAGDRLKEFELKIEGADYLTILKSGGGIVSTVKQTRAASAEALCGQSVRRLDKMLACGTTACEIKTGYGLDTTNELKMLDVIERIAETHPVDVVPTLLAAHTIPVEYKSDPEVYVDLICSQILPDAARWRSESQVFASLPFFVDVFCELGAFTLQQTKKVFDAARRLESIGLKVHTDQFTNLGAATLAIELGAVSVDHLDTITDEEIGLLANSNTVGVVIPTENFSGGKTKFADARMLIDRGCAVAISTDYNPGSAPCPSQPMAMAIACRYQKLHPAETLNAATINAAHAIGLGKTHGSIEVGKSADMLILDMADYRQLAYEFGSNQVAMVIKSGRPLYTTNSRGATLPVQPSLISR